jgi:hypothetical protein
MQNGLNLPPVFQLWQSTPQARGDISFEATAAPVEQVSLWSLDLPADPERASATLAQAEAQLQATQALLDEAPARLEAFVSRLQSGAEVHEAQFAVESTGGATIGAAEAALLPWIDALEPGQVSFGGEGLSRGEVGDAIAQLRQAVDNLLGQVLHLARVETRQQGALLASSLVDWTGDLDTTWGETVSVEEQSLHQRSLALALRARIALLRIIMTTTQGAAKIAALIAAPGGAFLALPAAWKYVQQLLAAISETQRSPSI